MANQKLAEKPAETVAPAAVEPEHAATAALVFEEVAELPKVQRTATVNPYTAPVEKLKAQLVSDGSAKALRFSVPESLAKTAKRQLNAAGVLAGVTVRQQPSEPIDGAVSILFTVVPKIVQKNGKNAPAVETLEPAPVG